MFFAFPGGNGAKQNNFSPIDVGARLRLWLRPESAKWTTSARSVLETGTGVIGAWDDDSGNGFHAIQATAGNRPSRRANGGVTFNGASTMQTNSAVGAWTGDFLVYSVFYMDAPAVGNNPRMVEINSSTGYSLTQSLTSGQVISNGGEGSPTFGQSVPASIANLHTCVDYRIGTVHGTSIDGLADQTNTVPTTALTDTPVNLAYSVGFPGNVFTGKLHEIAIIASPTMDEINKFKAYAASRVAAGIYV